MTRRAPSPVVAASGTPGSLAAPEGNPSRALHDAAARFRRLPGADVVWLAARESRSHAAVIRGAAGVDAPPGLGLRIEPRVGVGGSVMSTGLPWRGRAADAADGGLSAAERRFLTAAGVATVMVVPLRSQAAWSPDVRAEGVAYVGRRAARSFSDATLARALALGARVARPLRDAQRLAEAAQQWARAAADPAGTAPEPRLDAVAHAIAETVRVALRSIIGIVFRLDRASGALHALGVGGAAIPVVKRGQVLPPGCGAAGRAVATRAAFIARDYTAGAVQVPPLLAEAIAALPPITTLSVPLLVADEVIGALTVSRGTDAAYENDEVRLAEALAAHAAPVLARAQQASDDARRQQGASELSRLAGSLTQSLSVSAVVERLVQAVVALVRGTEATVWDPSGRVAMPGTGGWGLGPAPTDPRLRRILQRVRATGTSFWTPDLSNDPRIAEPEGAGPAATPHTGAVLVVPMRTHETLLALVGVTGPTGQAFTAADGELVQALADQAALALANARAYHDLQASRLVVLRHEKLVAAGRLAAGLAHELRNPLQNAVAFLAELRERADAVPAGVRPADPEFPGFLRQAQAEIRRAASIVDRLLDSVRERHPALAALDLRQVVTDAVALATPAATRGGTRICVAPADTPLPVQGDAVMLTQVVLNLLTNALDAIDGPGAVEIAMRREPAADGPGRVVVRIRDTGHGIAPEALPHVFDLFYTTKAVGKGVGLGLTLCQAMVEQHGGAITLTSPGAGQGATVVVELPADP